MQKGVIFPTLFLIHNCTSTANILIMLNATKKARENQDSKKGPCTTCTHNCFGSLSDKTWKFQNLFVSGIHFSYLPDVL